MSSQSKLRKYPKFDADSMREASNSYAESLQPVRFRPSAGKCVKDKEVFSFGSERTR